MRPFEFTRDVLGLSMRVLFYDEIYHERVLAALDLVQRFEANYSRFLKGNVLGRLNSSLGHWSMVSEECYHLFSFAQKMERLSLGAFDIGVKSLLEQWGYDADYSLEEKLIVHSVIERTQKIENVEQTFELRPPNEVFLYKPIEFGGFGKGYAIDQVVQVLNGLQSFLIDAGGDLYGRGLDPEGRPWRIAFEHPLDFTQAIGVCEIPFEGLALACSSPNRRRWRDRHHLVNPYNKAPANGMLAVYTQAASALEADAWATALFVMGFESAQKKLLELPLEAMLIAPSGAIFKTANFCGNLFVESMGEIF